MNILYNPFFIGKIGTSYLFDIDRIWISKRNEIRKYQDKALRRIIKYACRVPIYRDKFKENEIRPKDIKGLKDIVKLPIITKEDFRAYFPSGLIPSNCNVKDFQIIRTTGTTSQRLPMYTDFYTIIKTLLVNIRILKYHGIDWKRDKIALIPDLTQERVGRVYVSDTIPLLRHFFSLDNMMILDANDKRENLIKKLQKFKPDVIGSYPETLRNIAAFIEVKKIRNIRPRCIFSTGDYLDKYRKKYVENILGSKIFDIYDSTETGPIAFECEQGKYHVNSDFIHVGVKKNNEMFLNGTGEIVVTRLYGRGTPIVGYAGLDDVISIEDRGCSCGIPTGLIKKFYGRKSLLVKLPDGKNLFSSSLKDILFHAMYELGTNKIYRAQIIQKKVDEIKVLIKIDNEVREFGPSVKVLLDKIEKEYVKAFNSKVNVVVKEVEEIEPRTPFVIISGIS